LGSLLAYGRTVWDLAGLIARPITPENCRNLVRQRMRTREERFLALVGEMIYQTPRSPYLQLLKHAGVEEGDIRRMVQEGGVERSLEALRDNGVYLTFEEFKGLTDVVRGSRTFRFSERDFDNPRQDPGVRMRTGGTRSAGVPVNVSLAYIADQRAPARRLMLEALGGGGSAPTVLWLFSRRAVGMLWWISLSHTGQPPRRWFFIANPGKDQTTRGHLAMFRIGQIVGRLRGVHVPYPEFAPFEATGMVLDTVTEYRDRHGMCILVTSPSAAVRLAALALARGDTLNGVTIIGDAEPLTPAKAEEIRRTGARIGSSYAFREAGSIGAPCAYPEAPDDMHFLEDGFAMILRRRPIAGAGEVNAFMFSSLLPSASKIMLNVESDDFGEVIERRCGCLWDDLGLRRHLAYVRSFTKLTGEGMTVLGTETIKILEEVLPREFGGASVDYQLLEAEDDQNLTRLFLIISPVVGQIDEQRAATRFREELEKGSGRIGLWEGTGTILPVRRYPITTPAGKILPFYTQATAKAIRQQAG
jgi:hypothetical protein